ncbi:MAG: hypothetical protein MMC33_001311 [Icmadophila ericetorum]|nr:hypothetical protein [Icmadophila ericetorum]
MIHARGPFYGAPSKATPQTLCQKCLKRDIYECKASAQERPYVPRPSRTQQLNNPKLLPKLLSEVPNNLLRKKGVADEQLAKKDEERGRKRRADETDLPNDSRKRSRSSYSSSSFSTISTNRSRSASLKRIKHQDSDMYYSSQRTETVPSLIKSNGNKRQRSLSSSSRSYSSSSSDYHRRSSTKGQDRNTRRRRVSVSPATRGRERENNGRRSNRRTRSRSDSMDRGHVARNRNSITPSVRSNHDRDRGRGPPLRENGRRYTNDDDRYGGGREREPRDDMARRQPPPISKPKERSLSPFSKRLALTQALNMGR